MKQVLIAHQSTIPHYRVPFYNSLNTLKPDEWRFEVVFDPDEVALSGYQTTIGISELHIQNERIMPAQPYRGQKILERSIFFEDELTLRFNHRSLMLKIASLH